MFKSDPHKFTAFQVSLVLLHMTEVINSPGKDIDCLGQLSFLTRLKVMCKSWLRVVKAQKFVEVRLIRDRSIVELKAFEDLELLVICQYGCSNLEHGDD